MLVKAIYGYLIFSVCCGGVLGVLLWLDNRAERKQAQEAQEVDKASSTVVSETTNEAPAPNNAQDHQDHGALQTKAA